jgi:hypothetical protein
LSLVLRRSIDRPRFCRTVWRKTLQSRHLKLFHARPADCDRRRLKCCQVKRWKRNLRKPSLQIANGERRGRRSRKSAGPCLPVIRASLWCANSPLMEVLLPSLRRLMPGTRHFQIHHTLIERRRFSSQFHALNCKFAKLRRRRVQTFRDRLAVFFWHDRRLMTCIAPRELSGRHY